MVGACLFVMWNIKLCCLFLAVCVSGGCGRGGVAHGNAAKPWRIRAACYSALPTLALFYSELGRQAPCLQDVSPGWQLGRAVAAAIQLHAPGRINLGRLAMLQAAYLDAPVHAVCLSPGLPVGADGRWLHFNDVFEPSPAGRHPVVRVSAFGHIENAAARRHIVEHASVEPFGGLWRCHAVARDAQQMLAAFKRAALNLLQRLRQCDFVEVVATAESLASNGLEAMALLISAI